MTSLSQSELVLHVLRDHDDECSVTATLKSGSFSGKGRPWLHSTDIQEFITGVTQMAATSAGEVSLRGGYVNPDGSPDYTVSLRFTAHGLRGYILLSAELSSGPPSSNAEIQAVSRVAATLLIEPAALERFTNQLSSLAQGGSVEAAVPGECAA